MTGHSPLTNFIKFFDLRHAVLLLAVIIISEPSSLTVQSFQNNNKNVGRLRISHTLLRSKRIEYGVDVPYLEAKYDPHAAEQFYKDRPIESMKRLIEITTKSSGFILNTILDEKVFKKREEQQEATYSSTLLQNEQRSNNELLNLISDLGPTCIKIGQALSTRSDLLPAKYSQGLTKLQDAVPPFSGKLGRQVIEQELNIRINDVFSYLSDEPVASASIGQVYRGILKDSGIEVAVKVQRPGVLANVALDLYIMRNFVVPTYMKYNKDINTDLIKLVDTWGEGFINELDYQAEAYYTKEFSNAMKQRGLGSIFAPDVIDEFSSTHVLTTKWVDGERLSDSNANDVPRLCGVALNAYLTMLLDTGTLHCDPHPGNLLRTPDGRLCILDWGMVLNVPKDLQLSLLEFIANLNAENYDDVPDDLVKLQFVPKNKIEDLRKSGLTYGISTMLKLAAEGGGPKGAMQRMVAQNKEKYADALKDFDDLDSKEATEVRQRLFREDWQKQTAQDALSRQSTATSPTTATSTTSTTADVTMKIEQLQKQNSDVFAIPDYFVYMSRAFSTLEGIGLSSNPNYSILKECYPYLAKRLLSDDSPRARGALRTLLYGSKDGNELDLTKFQELSDGFESYTMSTSSVASSKGESMEGRNVALEQLANVVLSEDRNFVQDVLLRETAVALDAGLRDALVSPFTPIKNLPIVPALRPFTFPLELVKATLELQAVDGRDEKSLENIRMLSKLVGTNDAFGRSNQGSVNGNENRSISLTNDTVENLVREAAKRRVALARIGVRLGGSLASVHAERLRERAGVHGRTANKKNDISKLGASLAATGAETLDGLADLIASVDGDLGKRR